MNDTKWTKDYAGAYYATIDGRRVDITRASESRRWYVYLGDAATGTPHKTLREAQEAAPAEAAKLAEQLAFATADDTRFPVGQLVWNANTKLYAKVGKVTARGADCTVIEYLPGHNQAVGRCWVFKTDLIPQTTTAQEGIASAFVADPANPTDFELAAALDRGLADGSLIDSADWLLANHDAEPKLACAFARFPGHQSTGCAECAQDAQDGRKSCAVCDGPIAPLAGDWEHLNDADDDHTPVDPGDDAEAALRARVDQVATQIEAEAAKRAGVCPCPELHAGHLVGEHTVWIKDGVDLLDRAATYAPTVANVIGTVNQG